MLVTEYMLLLLNIHIGYYYCLLQYLHIVVISGWSNKQTDKISGVQVSVIQKLI